MKTHCDPARHDSRVSGFALSGIAKEQTMPPTAAQVPQAPLLEAMDFLLTDIRKKRIPLSALHLLIVIYRLKDKTARLNKLAKNIGVTTAGVTSVADHLDRMGLAVRENDPVDRRAILMKLTPEGVNFAELIEESLVSSMAKAFFKQGTHGDR